MGLGHDAPAVAQADAYNPMKEFTLTDFDGEVHQYAVLPHPPDIGQEIMWQMIAFGGEPLGALAQSLVAGADVKSLKGLLDDPKILESIDWGALGRNIASSVGNTNMSMLTGKMLLFTHRDSQPLRDKNAFNAAYKANYGELLRALWEVARINHFLGL